MNEINTIRQNGPSGLGHMQFENRLEPFMTSPDLLVPEREAGEAISFENKTPENFVEKTKTELPEKTREPNLWDKFRIGFVNGPDWLKVFRSYFTLSLNYFGIAFNSLAVIGKSFLPEKIYKFIDEKSEWYSRYIIPLSFGWNSLEALVGHRLPEALSRSIPAILFWTLPFYNFSLATGVSSALNYLFEHVKERHGGKNPGAGNLVQNFKQTMATSMDIIKDIVKGKRDKEDIFKQLATVFIFVGSIGGLLFSSKDRDTLLARFLGNMRNLGGLFADYKLIFNEAPDPDQAKYQREVGAWCTTGGVMDIFLRWVKNPELARMFNHIAIAANDMGLTRWAQVSKEDNDRELKNLLHATI